MNILLSNIVNDIVMLYEKKNWFRHRILLLHVLFGSIELCQLNLFLMGNHLIGR